VVGDAQAADSDQGDAQHGHDDASGQASSCEELVTWAGTLGMLTGSRKALEPGPLTLTT
jgi:hypothetical protein